MVYEARQILLRHLNQNPVLSSWQAVLDYCALTIRGEVERFHVLYLDRKNRLISDECLAIGTIDHVPVYPREVLREDNRAIVRAASQASKAADWLLAHLPDEDGDVTVAASIERRVAA